MAGIKGGKWREEGRKGVLSKGKWSNMEVGEVNFFLKSETLKHYRRKERYTDIKTKV